MPVPSAIVMPDGRSQLDITSKRTGLRPRNRRGMQETMPRQKSKQAHR